MGTKCNMWKVALWLSAIGAINWGLVGIGDFAGSNWNLVDLLLGKVSWLESVVYILVGISFACQFTIMADVGQIVRGVIAFVFGVTFMIVSWYIIPALIETMHEIFNDPLLRIIFYFGLIVLE